MNGVLTINLEPPYISFCSQNNKFYHLRDCTMEEIYQALDDFGGGQVLLKDCTVRLSSEFSPQTLAYLKLLPVHEIEYQRDDKYEKVS